MASAGLICLGLHRLCGQLISARPGSARLLNTTAPLCKFWERDVRAEYRKDRQLLPDKKQIIDGFQELKNEVKLWKDEVWDTFTKEPLYLVRPGKTADCCEMLIVREAGSTLKLEGKHLPESKVAPTQN